MAYIRVSICSDDPFFREGLRQVIRSERSLEIVDSDELPRKRLDSTEVDVVLVDCRTEGVLEHCAKRKSDRPFLIFLSVPDDARGVDALAVGARGIIRKQDSITDVVRAIGTVMEGRVWAPRHVVVDAWLRQRRYPVQQARAAVVDQRLTSRERDVVRDVTQGLSNKEVAERLAISTTTVKAHLTHIFSKLAVQGRGELIAFYHGALTADTRRDSTVRRRRVGSGTIQ